jgi:hypothetical protein
MTQEEIIKEFRERFETKIGSKHTIEEIESFLLQVRTDTINEIRREVERKKRKYVTQPAKYKGSDANVWREGYNSFLEDIKTFLNKLEK